MHKLLAPLLVACLMIFHGKAQSIDSLKLSAIEIPDGYVLTKDVNCISIQACTFFEKPEMFESLTGKIKSKDIQNFNSKKDKGSIMYFEFEDAFKGAAFLEGLLWGGNQPTREHPEELYTKGNILIIWSFKKNSAITKISRQKIMAILHE